jgi:PAS domain S-box-containing protein
MVERGSDLIVLTGPDRCLRYASPAFSRIFGEDAASHLGRPVWELVHPDDRQRLGDIFQDLVQRPGAVAQFECRFLRPDGAVRYALVTQTNLLDDPAVEAIVGNARDLTEQRLAAEARQELAALLAVADVVSLHRSLTMAVAIGHGVRGVAEVLRDALNATVVADDLEEMIVAQHDDSALDLSRFRRWRERTDLSHARAVRVDDWLLATAKPGDEPLGAIAVHDSGKRFDQAAGFAVEQAATVLAMELFRRRSVVEAELRVWSDLATELLDGADPDRTRSHASALGYDLDRPCRVVVVERGSSDLGSLVASVRRAARSVSVDASLMAQRAASVVLIVSEDADWFAFGSEIAREKGWLHRLGVGGQHEFASLGRSLVEAEQALRLGEDSVALFDQLGVWRSLAANADPDRLADLVEDHIASLIRYDSAHGTELLHTLSTFLQRTGGIDATAAGLHIHASTLKYRLARIQHLTGRDLRDPDDRFGLDFACRAYRAMPWRLSSRVAATATPPGHGGG